MQRNITKSQNVDNLGGGKTGIRLNVELEVAPCLHVFMWTGEPSGPVIPPAEIAGPVGPRDFDGRNYWAARLPCRHEDAQTRCDFELNVQTCSGLAPSQLTHILRLSHVAFHAWAKASKAYQIPCIPLELISLRFADFHY